MRTKPNHPVPRNELVTMLTAANVKIEKLEKALAPVGEALRRQLPPGVVVPKGFGGEISVSVVVSIDEANLILEAMKPK